MPTRTVRRPTVGALLDVHVGPARVTKVTDDGRTITVVDRIGRDHHLTRAARGCWTQLLDAHQVPLTTAQDAALSFAATRHDGRGQHAGTADGYPIAVLRGLVAAQMATWVDDTTIRLTSDGYARHLAGVGDLPLARRRSR